VRARRTANPGAQIKGEVETLSKAFTLLPGDVISTGTPSGVGVAMDPRQFLQPSDVVRIEIAEVGSIEHTFIEEPEGTSRF
jgi:2-keto-4-pentenoate hydratase/2-oxohepta-3-ene-1,7-dioic acid hydratase in catechol pathway